MDTLIAALPPLLHRTIPRVWSDAVIAHPDRPFLKWNDETFTYTDADALCSGAAAVLQREGVQSGDTVIIFMENCPEYIWLLIGLAKIGAIAVPINTEAKGPLLEYYLRDSEATFAVVDGALHPALLSALPDSSPLSHCWVRGQTSQAAAAGHNSSALRIDGATSESPVDVEPWTPALLMYTSGTTGPSKAVVVPHCHVVTTGEIVKHQFELVDQDCLFTCLPLFHVNAIEYTLAATICAQASMALSTRFSSRSFWSLIHKFGATVTNVMGSMLQVLEKLDPTEEERANTLERIFVVPFPNDPVAVSKRFGAKLMTMYGLSEWIPIAMSRPGDGYGRYHMAGPVLSTSQVRIVNENDIEVQCGEAGEIIVRAIEPWTQLVEYRGKPEATARAFRNGWFHTGDAGRLDADGYLYFTDRLKDAIRRRGENISAFEVEEFLRGEPRISEVAAVPVPSSMTEDDVAVFVVAREGDSITPTEVFEFAKDVLPRYMLPSNISVVSELPKTANTKVEKYKLVEWARSNLDQMHATAHAQGMRS